MTKDSSQSHHFKPSDQVFWLFKNGDKELCTVMKICDDVSMWVMWHKDSFVNIMPKSGFIPANDI